MSQQPEGTYRLRSIPNRFLAALHYRDYRTLWTASLFAGAAAWALIVARGWLAFSIMETNASLWVGVVTFMAMAPRFFLTPLIGFIADRFDRQTVLSWTYGLNLAHSVILALLVMFGEVGIWHLVVLSLVNGTLRSAQQTTAQSLIPNLVPRDRLLNAVALNQATQQGSRLVGPLAILPLLAFFDVAAAFWLCSAFYVLGLIQVLRVETRSRGKIDPNRSFLHNMAAGVIYTYQNPMLLTMVVLAVAHCSLTMSYESILPAISQEKLGAGSAGFSYLIAGVGAGALISSIFLAGIRNETTRGRVFLFFAVTSGLGPIALALSTNRELSIAATVFMGVNQAGFMTITHAIIQSIVPDEIRGRISAVYNMHVGGTMALANLTNGGLTDLLNAPLVLAAGGIIFIVLITSSVGLAPLRRIYFPRAAASPSLA
ncbi:MAG: MFS transporter [Dehalococcoidia bacterium]